MRILIISTFFPPLNSIASLRPYSWAKYWVKAGHKVRINRLIYAWLAFLAISATNVFAYHVISEKYSYFLLDENGQLVYSGGLPITSEGAYSIPVTIKPNRTAIIVMDPWNDMASDYLNAYYGEITENFLLPLVYRARDIGHKIIILTNDPKKIHYNTQISLNLLGIVDDEQVHLLYHQDYNDITFAKWLKNQNIDTLIYTGYASNGCVIGRQMGMIMISQRKFRLFFVPEASAAVETADTWGNKALHNAMATTISQWIGNIIHWNDLLHSMRD